MSSPRRRQLLAQHNRSSSNDSSVTPRRKTNGKFGELCGGTTADVTAVCCCFPCGVANLVVLAVYKVPAGLCRKATEETSAEAAQKRDAEPSEETDKAAVELENEMWDKFYGTGFWRSPSQHEGETF
ncbi:hypothetical protein F3Y22_tig00116937pilonHSYRG00248 [Hibiscus syriacus]|uniref:Uncharacterized protein n=1 Tax=Hibiscus syriacus TaxID=106335 RepID=A0A6A2XS47_HIBSY|nr:hypothetical protein F3Y22_tig00116937pilonHSYRG00248 [Hibiscus syriacus]